ncbi:MAG: hypothetical protein JWL62_645 [Hyphomicrobiales bacterium]|nr:hypothetical protein [Hyphomicrobiales bacterium]
MIVRTRADGSLVLITQNDHARLSGLFAAHWGNAEFEAPRTQESVIRAAAYHDWTWSRYEAAPHYDSTAKSTPNFRQVHSDTVQLSAYQEALDWVAGIDGYAGLLVSRHRTGLWRGRYDAIAEPPYHAAKNIAPELSAFIARNEARQEATLAGFDRATFLVDYQLLQIWDLLSLYWCTSEVPGAMRIAYAPTSYAGDGKTGVPLILKPLGRRRVAIDPFPFEGDTLEGGFVYRHLPTADFADVESFRRALWGAVPHVEAFEFVRKA